MLLNSNPKSNVVKVQLQVSRSKVRPWRVSGVVVSAYSAVLAAAGGGCHEESRGAAPEYKYQSYAPPPLQLLAVCHPVERELEQGQKNRENV